MTELFQNAIASASALPDDMQDELAYLMVQFAGVEQPPIKLTAEEQADLDEADAEIARGELAADEEVRALWAKYGG